MQRLWVNILVTIRCSEVNGHGQIDLCAASDVLQEVDDGLQLELHHVHFLTTDREESTCIQIVDARRAAAQCFMVSVRSRHEEVNAELRVIITIAQQIGV